MKPRMLIISRRKSVRERIRRTLFRLGCSLKSVADIKTARRWLNRQESPHLLILECASLGGPESLFLDHIHKSPRLANIFTLVMTTDKSEQAMLDAFAHNADEFLAEPIHDVELAARVRAMLRRIVVAPAEEKMSLKDITLNTEEQQAWIGGREIPLTHTEYQLLHLLIQRSGRTLARAYLLRYLWNTSEKVRTRSIDIHISHLRKKLKSSTCSIDTVRQAGYRLVG